MHNQAAGRHPGQAQGGKELAARLVAVHAADEVIHDCQGWGLHVPPFLALGIVQVVGVDDAHHMVELVRPSPAVVVPREMLRLLQHRDISLTQQQQISNAYVRGLGEQGRLSVSRAIIRIRPHRFEMWRRGRPGTGEVTSRRTKPQP